MEAFKGEKSVKLTKTKEVFDYIDTELKINQISKEVYLKEDKEVHYPRGFEGGNKYETIQKFTYLGFDGKLPTGVYKAVTFGYGFTKTLWPFAEYINKSLELFEVVIEKDGDTELDLVSGILYLSDKTLAVLVKVFQQIFDKNKAEINAVLKNQLHATFPDVVKKPDNTYIANALAVSLSTWGNQIDEFSVKDKEAIKDLFNKLSLTTEFLSKDSLEKTKEIVDVKYIQETLKEFKALMDLKTPGDALEKNWQEFLEKNTWIFSTIFAQPIIFHLREAYAGGKKQDNTDGKFTDFIVKNALSQNVTFIEIKTHKTEIFAKRIYRGTDVFGLTWDMSGCVNQVLNQRDNFQKEFFGHKVKNPKLKFESFNSKCIVIIGMLDELSDEERKCFELYRSNSKDVEIITFDELHKKIEALQVMMTID